MSMSKDGEARSAIHTVGLTKYYGKHLGIEDVNSGCRKRARCLDSWGRTVQVKSTTIRTVLDEIRPTAGSATILGSRHPR